MKHSEMKHIELNDLILWNGHDDIKSLKQAYPYLFFPKNMSLSEPSIFNKISWMLLTQHWLTTLSFRHTTMLRNEAKAKKDDLYQAVSESIIDPQANDQPSLAHREQGDSRINPKYTQERQSWLEGYEEHFQELGDPDLDYLKLELAYGLDEFIFPVLENTIKQMETENMIRAFSGLNRELNRSLKLLKEHFHNEFPEKVWETVEKGRKESELIHCLREFEKNSSELNTGPFRRKTSPFYDLRCIRNAAEHESDFRKIAEQNLTEEALLKCFDETRLLFELLEQDPIFSEERKKWLP